MGSNADAVVNPWAMVIVSLDANVTDSAMSRSGGSDNFTVRAKISRAEHSQQFHKFNLFFVCVFKDARVFFGDNSIGNEHFNSNHAH